jgi:hypothetical protein
MLSDAMKNTVRADVPIGIFGATGVSIARSTRSAPRSHG